MSQSRRLNPASEDQVFLGLQKKQQCKLCEQVFYVDSLPAVISYKSILMLRKNWGMNVTFLSPSLMYRQVKICVFCEQFFSSMKDKPSESLGLPTKVRGPSGTQKLSNTLTSTTSSTKSTSSSKSSSPMKSASVKRSSIKSSTSSKTSTLKAE